MIVKLKIKGEFREHFKHVLETIEFPFVSRKRLDLPEPTEDPYAHGVKRRTYEYGYYQYKEARGLRPVRNYVLTSHLFKSIFYEVSEDAKEIWIGIIKAPYWGTRRRVLTTNLTKYHIRRFGSYILTPIEEEKVDFERLFDIDTLVLVLE